MVQVQIQTLETHYTFLEDNRIQNMFLSYNPKELEVIL